MKLTSLLPRTPQFDHFISPARAKKDLWRLALGIVLVVVIWFGWQIGSFFAVKLYGPSEIWNALEANNFRGLSRVTLAITMFGFVGLVIGVIGVLGLLHRRSVLSLFGPIAQSLRDFRTGTLVFSGVTLVFGLPLVLLSGTVPHEPLGSVILFLPVVVVMLLLQTGAEELFFRGYILQQLAARFQSPWIWFVLPPILFGLMHFDSTLSTSKAIAIVLSITLTGFLWADLVRVTGNLGAAFGWHFANNFMIMTVVGFNDYLNGFAWRLLTFGYADAPLALFIYDPLVGVITWGILRRLLRR